MAANYQKTCPACATIKPETEFYFNRLKNYYQSYCKDCVKLKSKQWEKANPERTRELQARRREKHREAIRAYNKEYKKKWRAKRKALGLPQ